MPSVASSPLRGRAAGRPEPGSDMGGSGGLPLLLLTAVSVVLAVLLCILSWKLKPNPGVEAIDVFALPAIWGLFEVRYACGRHLRGADSRHRMMRIFVIWLAFCIALDSGPELAIYTGRISTDLAVAHTVTGLFLALSMVLWGNYLPKVVSPWNVGDEPFDWQRVHRFAGRACVLSGVLAVAAWMILPYEKARLVSTTAVVTATLLIVAYKWTSLSRP